MHLRWLVTQVEERLLDMSFENNDATSMQAGVILLAGANAGMRMLRSHAVLSSLLAQQASSMPLDAVVRVFKAAVLSGTLDNDVICTMSTRLSRSMDALTLAQQADIAHSAAVGGAQQHQALLTTAFIHATRHLKSASLYGAGSVHPYTLYQLYTAHVAAMSVGDRGLHEQLVSRAVLPTELKPVMKLIRDGVLQAQISAQVSASTRSSGSWHLAPAHWRSDVSHALRAAFGDDAASMRTDATAGNRFLVSHVLPKIGLALHCAPASSYLFGPVRASTCSSFDSMSFVPEQEVPHFIRPSVQLVLDCINQGRYKVSVVPFSSWPHEGDFNSQHEILLQQLSISAANQLRMQ
jgi:hypothetical protein